MSPNILFILFCVWSALMIWIGYKTGQTTLKDNAKIEINSLAFKQAVKWIFIHERRRHKQDIAGIEKDLQSLKDVELPPEVEKLAGKVRFEI